MRITWHILRMHIGPFLFGTFAVVFIFLLQFIFKFLNELVGKGLSYWVIGKFISYNLAWMLVLAVPMGVLVATLMAYGKLSGNNELTILKSAGGSAFRTMLPAIFGGALLFLGLYLFNDKILPETNHQAYVMQTDIKQFRPTAAIDPGQFSKLGNYRILAREVDREANSLSNVTIYHQRGAALTVINAKQADIAYNPDLTMIIMSLLDGEVQSVDRNDRREFRRYAFHEYQLKIEVAGQKFQESDPTAFGRNDRTMNIEQMQAIADTALAERERTKASFSTILKKHIAPNDSLAPDRPVVQGLTRKNAAQSALSILAGTRTELQRLSDEIVRKRKQANKYFVEIHKKYAIPAACLIFVFVGAPLGIVVRRGNFGVSAVIALGFFIVYWACLVAGEKLADRDILHPALAMWMADIVIGVIGVYLTILVSRETVTLNFDFDWVKRLKRRFSRQEAYGDA